MSQDSELDRITYESLQVLADERYKEIQQLKALLKKWQEGDFDKPKHIITVGGEFPLSAEQFERIKQQCNEHFGAGKFLLLEGGMEYSGMTHQLLKEPAK